MKNLPISLLLLVLLFSSCSEAPTTEESTEGLRAAKGGKNYGGLFRVNETDHYETLFPPFIEISVAQRVGAQIYEGLVKLDQSNLVVMPSLAENWQLDTSRTVYTFKLREDVMFQDDPCFQNGKGRKVLASDFKLCLENLANPENENQGYKVVLQDVVQGATEYHNGQAAEIKGIEVLDEHTLQITLLNPKSTFLYLLSMPYCWLYPMEAYQTYGSDLHLGTGPFVVDSIADQELWLARNDNYYGQDADGNQLPFLDALNITFISETDSVVEAFKRGEYHLIYQLPTDYIIDIIEFGTEKGIAFKDDRQSEMLVQYYEMQNASGVFSDKQVRQAFSYALDREMILNKILQGDGVSGHFGITPAEAFEGYDVSQIQGYRFDLDKAKSLLAAAGYKGGKGFPEITLDVNAGTGRIYIKVAEEVSKQLRENLGVNLVINEISFDEKNENARVGKSSIWRSGWRSDYPHPESFLSLFYGRNVPADLSQPSYPNTSRFVNEEFDKLYEQGLAASSIEEGYPFFMQAEQILMEESPMLVLYYSENYRILQPNVANFPNNPMQFREFREVYFEEIEKEIELEASTEEASTE
jgi:peptide/nickel transport system substrate-binding protein